MAQVLDFHPRRVVNSACVSVFMRRYIWFGPREQRRRNLAGRWAPALALALASCLTLMRAATAAGCADYAIRSWRTEDGLPQNSVLSIAQTPDGYLWLATYNGLARFDGVRFKVYQLAGYPGLPSNRLVRVFADSHGVLWLVSEEGALVRKAGEKFEVWSVDQGIPAHGVELVAEDAAGRVWLADRDGGVHRLAADRFESLTGPTGFGSGSVTGIVVDGEGTVFVEQSDRVGFFREGRFVHVQSFDDEGGLRLISMAASGDGSVWMVAQEGVRKYHRGQWEAEVWAKPESLSGTAGTREDREGNLWVAPQHGGLFRLSPAGQWDHFTLPAEWASAIVQTIQIDREGTLWVGTDGGGLHRFCARVFQVFGTEEGLPGDVVLSVTQDQTGRVLAGVHSGGVHYLEHGRFWPLFPEESPLRKPNALCLWSDHAVGLWVGNWDAGALCWKPTETVALSRTAGFPLRDVRALLEDRAGSIWLGGQPGLCRYAEGHWEHYGREQGLWNEDVRALAQGLDGTLYIGSNGGGLHRLAGGRITPLSRGDGRRGDAVTCLWADREGDLWVGTSGGGFSRYRDGKFTIYSRAQGLPVEDIASIVEDEVGNMWLGSNRGILRTSKRALNELAGERRRSVDFTLYDGAAGLASTDCSGGLQPACCRAQDGRLWFATAKGVAVVDPRRMPTNPVPPSVVIEEVWMDDVLSHDLMALGPPPAVSAATDSLGRGRSAAGTARPEGAALTVKVPPGKQRIEFRYTALTFKAPEQARFRYRLEGWDGDWIEADTRRAAYYTRVAPGHYRFRVTARNNDGVWNEIGAAVGVIVLAPWYRTWWACSLGGLLAAGLAVWFYEARLRRLRHARALQADFSRRLADSQEAERKRMAKELHDGLGQNLILIKNRAQLGLLRLDPPEPLAEQLREISEAAGGALDDMRATARALHPYELDRLGLTQAIEAMSQRAGETSPTKFLTDLEDLDGLFLPETQIQFYRILQEGINNVLKHAQATEVILEVKREAGGVRATLLDDGCGFDPVALGAAGRGGLGLPGMAERASLIGGALQLHSAPGRGTRLEVTIRLPSSAHG
jgi:signal transduction histidine kinase/ligand-binding sensor domain-containing protein